MKKPIFFDRNLTEIRYDYRIYDPSRLTPYGSSGNWALGERAYYNTDRPTRSEPTDYMVGIGDIMENIRDQRKETKITLGGISSDINSPNAVKFDGEMDDHTKYTSINTLSTNTTDFMTGTASVQLVKSSGYYIGLQKATYAPILTNIKYAQVLYMWVKCNTETFSIIGTKGLTFAVSDGTVNYFTTVKYDVDGLAPTVGVWQLYRADMRTPTSASSYSAPNWKTIQTLGVSAETVGAGSATFLFDGFRACPSEYIFEYSFGRYGEAYKDFTGFAVNSYNATKTLNLIHILTTSGKVDVYSWSGTAWVFYAGESDITGGAFINYSATGITAQKFRVYVNLVNQVDNDFGVDITNFILASQLYTWDTDFQHIPRIVSIASEADNYFGAKKVDKFGTFFNCTVKSDGVVSKADLDFITTILRRDEYMYFWLNGDRADIDFKTLSEAFARQSIYAVVDTSKRLELSQYDGIGDTGKIITGANIDLVESAYIDVEATPIYIENLGA